MWRKKTTFQGFQIKNSCEYFVSLLEKIENLHFIIFYFEILLNNFVKIYKKITFSITNILQALETIDVSISQAIFKIPLSLYSFPSPLPIHKPRN